jgi:hypothetical protein
MMPVPETTHSPRPEEIIIPRSDRVQGLGNLAPRLLDILRASCPVGTPIPLQRVVDSVASEAGVTATDRTTRRRVYDVLNVFAAIGVIEKSGFEIRFMRDPGAPMPAPNVDTEDARRTLIDKVQQLLAIRCLRRRNVTEHPGFPAVRRYPVFGSIILKLPRDIMIARNGGDAESVLVANADDPDVWAPMEIGKSMNWDPVVKEEEFQKIAAKIPCILALKDQIMRPPPLARSD